VLEPYYVGLVYTVDLSISCDAKEDLLCISSMVCTFFPYVDLCPEINDSTTLVEFVSNNYTTTVDVHFYVLM